MPIDESDLKRITRALLLGASFGTLPMAVVGCDTTGDAKDRGATVAGVAETQAELGATEKSSFLAAATSADARDVERFLASYPNSRQVPGLLAALPPRTLSSISPAVISALPEETLAQVPPIVMAMLRVPSAPAPSPDQPNDDDSFFTRTTY